MIKEKLKAGDMCSMTKLRVTPAEFEFMTAISHRGKATDGLRYTIDYLDEIVQEATEQIKGKFSAEEWKYMANVIRVASSKDYSRTDKESMVKLFMASRPRKVFREKYLIDDEELEQKIRTLTKPQLLAVSFRIATFWMKIRLLFTDDLLNVKEEQYAEQFNNFASH